MNLENEFKDIVDNIKEKRFCNEAAVKQGIILRILGLLNWVTHDVEIVAPEFNVEGRRVDYALCYPRSQPVVFIEVKQIGKLDCAAERQLFEYAFHLGVPMAILTDGQEWQFFLPAEKGQYQERRVYRLDLLERNLEDIIFRFKRYLDYKNVASNQSIESARKDYKDIARDRKIQETIPLSWIKLIEERDELLIELLSDKIESMCGYKPPEELVTDFLTKVLDNPINRVTANKVSTRQPEEKSDSQSSVLTSPERHIKQLIVYPDQKLAYPKILLLNPEDPGDLKFTAVKGSIGGEPGKNWKQLVVKGIGLALNHGHDIDNLHVNIIKGKYTEKGYAYASHLNISVQDIDANRAFKTLLQITKMLKCKLELEVTWTKKYKSKLPGEQAKLRWP